MVDHPTLPFEAAEPPEEWRAVVGYEGLYEVSSLGRIRSLPRCFPDTIRKIYGGQIRKLALVVTRGYSRYEIVLYRGGVRQKWLVHRLVAEAFIGPIPEGKIVCHGPRGSLCNEPSNLGFGTHRTNMWDKHRDGTMPIGEANGLAKLTDDAIRDARTRYAAGGVTMTTLAAEFGVSKPSMRNAIRGKTWKHVA